VCVARVATRVVRKLLLFCSLVVLARVPMSRSIAILPLVPSVAVHFTSLACSSEEKAVGEMFFLGRGGRDVRACVRACTRRLTCPLSIA
jgi:hypothetical protein